MDARENRARSVETQKVSELLDKVRNNDTMSGISSHERNLFIVSSGTRDITPSVVSIVKSGNATIDKCIMTFSALSIEIDQLVLEAKSRYYDALLLYGEETDESCIEKEGGVILLMSDFLPFLHELLLFVNRCYEVCRNLVVQLYSFFSLTENQLPKARERTLSRSWRYLGELLAILLTLDEIILGNQLLKMHWIVFSKSIQSVNHNPSQFNANDARLKPLQNIIAGLELQILSGRIFQNCIQQKFMPELQIDKIFIDKFQKAIVNMLAKWDRLAQEDVPDKQRLIVIVSLAVLFYHFYPTTDKKLLRNVAATYKRIAAFHLIGDLLWTPVEFMIQKLPEADKVIDKKTIASVASAKAAMLDQQAEALSRETKLTEDAIEEWKGELYGTKTQRDFNNNTHQYLSDRCALMLKGARVADKISRLLRCALNGHLVLNRSLSKINAQNIFRFMELIKEIESTFRLFWPQILEWSMHSLQYWSGCILRILDGISTGLSENLSNIDMVSALLVAESVLGQSPTKTRLITCGVALEMANYTKIFRSSDVNEIDDLLTRLDSIASLGTILNRITGCSFFYWHRSLAKIYFESIIDEKFPNYRIEAFMIALNDSCDLLRAARHCKPEKLISQFSTEILTDFKEYFHKWRENFAMNKQFNICQIILRRMLLFVCGAATEGPGAKTKYILWISKNGKKLTFKAAICIICERRSESLIE